MNTFRRISEEERQASDRFLRQASNTEPDSGGNCATLKIYKQMPAVIAETEKALADLKAIIPGDENDRC